MAFKKDDKGKDFIPCPDGPCKEKIYPGKWKHGSHPVPEELRPDYERFVSDASRREKDTDNPKGDDKLVGKVKNAHEAFGEALAKHLSPKK